MPKRKLSHREILNCERATSPASSCKCRCHGALHGANRVPESLGASGFSSLPTSDPHHLATSAERRTQTTNKKQSARLERNRQKRAEIDARLEARRIAHGYELVTPAPVQPPAPRVDGFGRPLSPRAISSRTHNPVAA